MVGFTADFNPSKFDSFDLLQVGSTVDWVNQLRELGSEARSYLQSHWAPHPAEAHGKLQTGACANVLDEKRAQETSAPEQERELEGEARQDQTGFASSGRAEGEDVEPDEGSG